jgi:hypothetical protein
MRNLLLSLVALGSLAAHAATTPVAAQPVSPGWFGPGVQTVQYYDPDWRQREEWRRRREFEERRREEWRRAHEAREEYGYRPPPPPPYYGPRY